MDFTASESFVKKRPVLMTDEEFDEFKKHLADHPDGGDAIPGAGGFRKIRWANIQRQKGASGGSRSIYLFIPLDDTIWLAAIYDHEEKKDLSRDEIAELKDFAAELKNKAKAARDAREKGAARAKK